MDEVAAVVVVVAMEVLFCEACLATGIVVYLRRT